MKRWKTSLLTTSRAPDSSTFSVPVALRVNLICLESKAYSEANAVPSTWSAVIEILFQAHAEPASFACDCLIMAKELIQKKLDFN